MVVGSLRRWSSEVSIGSWRHVHARVASADSSHCNGYSDGTGEACPRRTSWRVFCSCRASFHGVHWTKTRASLGGAEPWVRSENSYFPGLLLEIVLQIGQNSEKAQRQERSLAAACSGATRACGPSRHHADRARR
jgi:hypothetical protein